MAANNGTYLRAVSLRGRVFRGRSNPRNLGIHTVCLPHADCCVAAAPRNDSGQWPIGSKSTDLVVFADMLDFSRRVDFDLWQADHVKLARVYVDFRVGVGLLYCLALYIQPGQRAAAFVLRIGLILPAALFRLDPNAHVTPVHLQYPHRNGPGKPICRTGRMGIRVRFNKHTVARSTGIVGPSHDFCIRNRDLALLIVNGTSGVKADRPERADMCHSANLAPPLAW
jgi:hypothetical protein